MIAQPRPGMAATRSAPKRAPSSARLSAVVVAALAGGPALLGAQAVGSMSGLVVDQANLQPVEHVLVALHDLSVRSRTDEEGRFFLSVPAGEVIIKVEAAGYVTLVEAVEIAPSEESLIQFRLHRVTALLDEVFVGVSPTQEGMARADAELWSDPTDGDVRTAADLLLRSVPGLSARRTQGTAGSGLVVHLRGVSSMTLTDRPAIYLDGVRINAGDGPLAIDVLDQIPASTVKRIRVLRGPASVSMYPNAAAGVILIETGGVGNKGPGG